jgi:hypothetical protein
LNHRIKSHHVRPLDQLHRDRPVVQLTEHDQQAARRAPGLVGAGLYEQWLFSRRPSPPGHGVDPAKLRAPLPELQGRDLLCWCAPERCHGEVLLRLGARLLLGETKNHHTHMG